MGELTTNRDPWVHHAATHSRLPRRANKRLPRCKKGRRNLAPARCNPFPTKGQQEVEQLVVEAMRVGVELAEVLDAVEAQWEKIEKPWEVNRK